MNTLLKGTDILPAIDIKNKVYINCKSKRIGGTAFIVLVDNTLTKADEYLFAEVTKIS